MIRDLALRGKFLDRKYAASIICACGVVMDEIDFADKHKECPQRANAWRKDDMSPEKIELGIAWEERLAHHHPEICFHPGEIIVDGLPMTVDGASYDDSDTYGGPFGIDEGGAVHEFKLTWKSSRYGIDGEWMWLAQVKAYAHGLTVTGGMPHRVGFVHVYWVNGNYSRNPADPEDGPNYYIYESKFTDLEIMENWRMLLAHKARMEGKGHKVSIKRQ